ncbi:butyrophilin subfamily 2 member A2-like isoform X1, partial [Silurus meridionalis]
GSSVVLPCWLTPVTDAENLEIRWYRPDQFKNPLLLYQNRKVITDLVEMYINRSSLTLRNPQSAGLKQGDVSLRLDNIGLSDIGIFHCYVSGDKSYNSNTVKLSLTALGSFPHLSLEHRHDSVNLSCSSCGWFPKPSLLWKSTNEKGDLSERQSPIYSEQENGLFCIYSWVILSSSVSNSMTCLVTLSEDEKRNVSLEIGAGLPVENSGVWKILFTLALLCVLALVGIVLFRFYRKYKSKSDGELQERYISKPSSFTKMMCLWYLYNPIYLGFCISVVTDYFFQYKYVHKYYNVHKYKSEKLNIILDKESCKKEFLSFNKQDDAVRDNDEAAKIYKGFGFPYELCVHGRNKFSSGRAYWEVGLKQTNVPCKKSWLIGVAKASYTISNNKEDFSPGKGFWFLCSDPENGLHVNTEPEIVLPKNITPESIGVLLDFSKSELSFYNVTDSAHIFTMKIKRNSQEELVPLFNPGIGDKAPLKI